MLFVDNEPRTLIDNAILDHSFTGWVCRANEGLGREVQLASGRRLAGGYKEPVNEDAEDACDGTITTIANPKITFDSVEQGNYTDVTDSFTFEGMSSVNTIVEGVYGLVARSQSCSLEFRSIVKHGDDFYIHVPRLDLLENSFENPAVHFGLTCPTVARTPINDASCKVVQTCLPLSGIEPGQIVFELSPANLELFYEKADKYAGLELRSSLLLRSSIPLVFDCIDATE